MPAVCLSLCCPGTRILCRPLRLKRKARTWPRAAHIGRRSCWMWQAVRSTIAGIQLSGPAHFLVLASLCLLPASGQNDGRFEMSLSWLCCECTLSSHRLVPLRRIWRGQAPLGRCASLQRHAAEWRALPERRIGTETAEPRVCTLCASRKKE